MSSPNISPFSKTPESAFAGLRRKDSKHALTTCHGITSNGRACRRPLAEVAAKGARYTIKGTVLVPKKGEDPAVFFCWQHKDQADGLIEGAQTVEIKERTSMETVLRGLGLEEVKEEEEGEEGRRMDEKIRERAKRRAEGQRMESKTMPISEKRRNQKPERKVGFLLTLFSCLVLDEEHLIEKPAHQNQSRPTPTKTASPRASRLKPETPSYSSTPPQQRRRSSNPPISSHPNMKPSAIRVHRDHTTATTKQSTASKDYHLRPPPLQGDKSTSSPSIRRRPLAPLSSQQKQRSVSSPFPLGRDQSLREWTPSLPPSPTDLTRLVYAKLLTTMSEPPTASDSNGYIYMFWQTTLPTSSPENEAASLVAAGTATTSQANLFERRARLDVEFGQGKAAPRTVLLKIGRAANVRRRLVQWRNQCRYNIELLRYWPQDKKDEKIGKQIKFVGKAEKLIHLHLEMLGLRAKRDCRCGTEHREWFEVEASAKAVREVDSVIGQWVRWCEEKYKDDDD